MTGQSLHPLNISPPLSFYQGEKPYIAQNSSPYNLESAVAHWDGLKVRQGLRTETHPTMTPSSLACIICKSDDMHLHFYPPNIFHGITYSYYRCGACGSLTISPKPEKEALNQMYNQDFHPYLKDFDLSKVTDPSNHKKLTIQRLQFDFLKELLVKGQNKSLLDFGCGGGIFIAYARSLGFDAVGIEYDEEFTSHVREVTKLPVYSMEEGDLLFQGKTFDIIHFGHVLEHLDDPYTVFEQLKKYAHADTLFVVDGPAEVNRCLSRFTIDFFSRIRKRSHNDNPPYHISFTNYDSQLLFFKNMDLETVKYKMVEQYWPLPDSFQWKSLSSVLMHCLALLSIFISSFIPKYGNVFHYVGRMSPKTGPKS
jgi:SAM-dependent methyltransferase